MKMFNIKFLNKDTPHSELLFSTELNQKTSNSGHNNLFHIIESTNMVRPAGEPISNFNNINSVMYNFYFYLNFRSK